MRALLLTLFLFLPGRAAPAAPEPPDLRENEVIRVDPAARTLVVGVRQPRTYFCRENATVLLDDQPAALADLAPGMIAIVTAPAPGIAVRVAAVRPKTSRPAEAPLDQRQVTVPAAATARTPVVIGGVQPGQIVTIRARPIRWTAGGARAGKFCDWNGYADDRIFGLPRMALVAVVGKGVFLPTGETFRFTTGQGGGLVLFVNDDDPAGNEGVAEVTVSVSWK